MPAHDVEMSIPTTKVVLHADVVFEIRSDDEKLGELRVARDRSTGTHRTPGSR